MPDRSTKKPRQYQMGWCVKHRRRYRLPLSADPSLPALAQCDECFREEMNADAETLRRLMEKPPETTP